MTEADLCSSNAMGPVKPSFPITARIAAATGRVGRRDSAGSCTDAFSCLDAADVSVWSPFHRHPAVISFCSWADSQGCTAGDPTRNVELCGHDSIHRWAEPVATGQNP